MELPFEFGIIAGMFVLLGELAEREDERLRHITAAVRTKAALSIRDRSTSGRHRCLTSRRAANCGTDCQSVLQPGAIKLRYHAGTSRRRPSGVFLTDHSVYNRRRTMNLVSQQTEWSGA